MAKLAIRSNRKFRRLVGMLRMDSPRHVEGHLIALWRATWENGNSLIGDFADIEALAEWTDMSDRAKYPTGAFAAALVLTGFVDTIVDGELYAVHDWYDHAEAWAKQRVSRAAKEDPTVCAETFFLGLDAWRRRAAELGIPIAGEITPPETSESDEDPDLPPDPETAATDKNYPNGDRNARRIEKRSPKQAPGPGFGHLSSLAEPSQAETSEGTLSPSPLSPSPLALPDSPLWSSAKGILRDHISREQFDTFVQPLRFEDQTPDLLTLRAPSRRHACIVAESMRDDIAAALSLAADRPMSIEVTA